MTMRPYTVLVVDDDKLIRWVLEKELRKWGYETACAGGVEEARLLIQKTLPDLVILDQVLPDGTGTELLDRLSREGTRPQVILLTAFDRTDVAVSAMKLGAVEYLTKPVKPDELKLVVDRVFEGIRLRRQVAIMQEEQWKQFGGCVVIGTSGVMQAVHDFTTKLAPVNSSVLIAGETGTGKELVARRIHFLSRRKDRPLVAVNCATMSDTLLESELFGHEKGSFTDAIALKRGLLEEVEGGTLFLDEVDEMRPSVQVKVLRVLEEKRARPVGSTKDYAVDVRIIAASNRKLEDAVEQGKFRRDLFYRLNVASVVLPPLRARGEDIVLLAEHFLQEFNRVCNKNFKGFAPGVLETFRRHTWPGNVRELRNVIERAVILKDGEYLKCQIKAGERFHSMVDADGSLVIRVAQDGMSLFDLEKHMIILALQSTGYNQSEAAKLLRISRNTLRYRMRKYRLVARSSSSA